MLNKIFFFQSEEALAQQPDTELSILRHYSQLEIDRRPRNAFLCSLLLCFYWTVFLAESWGSLVQSIFPTPLFFARFLVGDVSSSDSYENFQQFHLSSSLVPMRYFKNDAQDRMLNIFQSSSVYQFLNLTFQEDQELQWFHASNYNSKLKTLYIMNLYTSKSYCNYFSDTCGTRNYDDFA